jgi:hypothetical protein
MTFQFKKATKEQAKLHLAIFGPSGSGKTFTGLRLATGLGGSVAVIDTERGSASKYADRFNFDVLDLPRKDINTYCEAIAAAGQAGYAVLVIDSLTHAWHELLEEVDKLASAKYRGNTWSAWSEGTPKQRRLVNTILDFPGHVIATMRTKTEWTVEETDRGKTKPIRVGLAPEQGKGIEYEFDLLMEINVAHIGTVIKDRTGKYQDQTIDKPGEELGRELAAWLSEGNAPAPKASPPPAPEPTNGNGDADKRAFFNRVVLEIPYFTHTKHAVNALRALGFNAYSKDAEAEMFGALQKHANEKANEEADQIEAAIG